MTALVLAYLSKRFVEDPVRRWDVLTGSTRLTFAAMVLGLAAVGLAVAALL
ncbi:hypothetical protein [Streptomyces sp. KL116D]|uniref:hypothetical protein n=1 Tax=Streptomyces sp. KL116D TaxID=3045152 RepID=UPI003556A0B2